MLTIDNLNEFGVNIKEGLGRCMNNEPFYLRLVNMALDDDGFAKLTAAVEAGDKKAGFEAAHALKGALSNLALTPLSTRIAEMTELLRSEADADYPALLAEVLQLRDQLVDLRD